MRGGAGIAPHLFLILSHNRKTMRTLLAFLLLIGSTIIYGCGRECQITRRAKQQLPVSLEYGMSKFVSGFRDPKIEDLKIVYENDSICLLQFTAAYKDTTDAVRRLDFRYIYLYDSFMSFAEKKPVYNEDFRNILCLPDELIKQSRKDVKKNKEVVYNDFIGTTFPVKTPFDE